VVSKDMQGGPSPRLPLGHGGMDMGVGVVLHRLRAISMGILR